jgi:hypothetical protein
MNMMTDVSSSKTNQPTESSHRKRFWKVLVLIGVFSLAVFTFASTHDSALTRFPLLVALVVGLVSLLILFVLAFNSAPRSENMARRIYKERLELTSSLMEFGRKDPAELKRLIAQIEAFESQAREEGQQPQEP